MRTFLLIFLWPAVAFGQSWLISAGDREELGASTFIDINGDNRQELRYEVIDQDTHRKQLVFFDVDARMEIMRYPIGFRNIADITSGDINGDGIVETLILGDIAPFKLVDEIGFIVIHWENGNLVTTPYTEFGGAWGHVGDLTGDGQDEIILVDLPQGYTNLGGTGPRKIQVLTWNGSGFESIAIKSFPTMYLRTRIADLDNDGRAEVIALISGYKDETTPHPRQVIVYSYTGEQELTQLDETEIPMGYDDNLTLLWTQPLPEGGHRIIVPVVADYDERIEVPMEILRYQGFQLQNKRLVWEQEPLSFKWRDYNKAPLTLTRRNMSADIDNDGDPEYLQFDEDWKRLRFVKKKELPPLLPR